MLGHLSGWTTLPNLPCVCHSLSMFYLQGEKTMHRAKSGTRISKIVCRLISFTLYSAIIPGHASSEKKYGGSYVRLF